MTLLWRSAPLVTLALLSSSGCTGEDTVRTVTIVKTVVATSSVGDEGGAGRIMQPESCRPVAHGTDGTVSPVVCPDGHPNAYAMTSLQRTAPAMMALGEFASENDIERSACLDLPHSTNPIEQSAYEWVKALNGWSFAVDPTDSGLFSYC